MSYPASPINGQIYGNKKFNLTKNAWEDYESTSISNTGRVMQINGNGVPTIPDNVAGITYKSNFATADGWTALNGSISVSNGILTATATADGLSIGRNVSTLQNKLIGFRVKTNKTSVIVSSGATDLGNVTCTPGVWTILWAYCTIVGTNINARLGGTEVAGDYLSVSDVYIGSGLYDTPVYDKACCNRFTNNGVLPVKGLHGQALSFNGVQYLQADNPVIGTTGTIAFKFSPSQITSQSFIIDNSDSAGYTGVRFQQVNNGASLWVVISNATSQKTIELIPTLSIGSSYTVKLSISGTNAIWSINAGSETTTAVGFSPSIGISNLKIGGRSTALTSGFFGIIEAFRYDARIWTQDDVTRYHNGDDAVDSQQKSINGVPHAIAVNDANGFLGSNGLRFPATQVASSDANTLDDYEEGTFTPGISFGGGTTGITYSTQSGKYTKIGNTVFIKALIVLTSKGTSTGSALYTGLPFACGSTQVDRGTITVGEIGITYGGTLQLCVLLSSTSIGIFNIAETGVETVITDTNFSNTSTVRISGFYTI